jgi:hypothetical protein
MNFSPIFTSRPWLRSIVPSALLGLCSTAPSQASGLYVFQLSGHTTITSDLLAGKVTLGDPYRLRVDFEISGPDMSSDPASFTSVTPEGMWHLTIGKNFSRTFAAGTAFALAKEPGGSQSFEIRNMNPLTLGGVEFPADSVRALRIGGIALEDPFPVDYRLGTVLNANYNAPGSSFSRLTWGDLSDPAFQGAIERVSLAPSYEITPVPESTNFALGGLIVVATAAAIRLRRQRRVGG